MSRMPEPSRKTVARTVRRLRRRRGWTQVELAHRASLSPTRVSRLEYGHRSDIKTATIDAIAAALGVHPAVLLGGRPPRSD